jgi:hypothetical protein
MADVSTKLLGQFVSCLEKNVLGATADASAPAAEEAPAEQAPAEVGASREGAAAGAAASASPGPQTREPGGASDAALAGGTSGSNGKSSPASTGPRTVTSKPAEPVDLLGTAGSPVIKRLVPALVGALVAFIIGRRIRRRCRG